MPASAAVGNEAEVGEALDKLNKKAAVLTSADASGLADKLVALGGVKADAASLAQTMGSAVLAVSHGKGV